MKFLLDTHILLWWMQDSPELPAEARDLVRDPANTIFVSAVNLWEIRIKEAIGKIRLPANFDEVLAKEEFETIALTADHVTELTGLPLLHRDPFDRILIAQARATRITLLTADNEIASYGDGVHLARRASVAS